MLNHEGSGQHGDREPEEVEVTMYHYVLCTMKTDFSLKTSTEVSHNNVI